MSETRAGLESDNADADPPTALKPGNAGRAKGPDFWCAFEDGEVTVIGDEPANTDYDPGSSEKAVS